MPTEVLRIGTSGDYAPFSTIDADGLRRGLDIDIAERLAADLGASYQIVPFRWPDLTDDLAAGRFDLAISGITMRPDRAVRLRSTRPYATTGVVVLLGDGAFALNRVALDTAARRIGVNAGGHLEAWARRHFAHAKVVAVRGNQTLPDRLADGTFDAIVSDSAEVPGWIRPDWEILGPLSADYKAIFLPIAATELSERIDAWLAAREEDGWLVERRRAWGIDAWSAAPEESGWLVAWRRAWLGSAQAGDAAQATRFSLVSWIALRLGLMPAVGASKRVAGLPIEDPGQEERVLARVASLAPRSPNAVGVYRRLIEAAKRIQRQSTDALPVFPLTELRGAITRIDQQLLRELARAPLTTVATWRRLLGPALAALPLTDEDVAHLADALAASSITRRKERKGGRSHDATLVLE